ncbi:MAG: tetratricopeptide repeat protein [Caldilineaceae bacterium]|nr:tetratricopeptide repeat protein [Caldilineaceae bacterium]
MTADLSSPSPLPEELQARLAVAGVTNEASLHAALAADPQLAADLEAFAQQHVEELAPVAMLALFAQFSQADTEEEMREFWRSVPAGMEEPFMGAVEQMIGVAEAMDEAAAADLRARLDGFRQIHQNAQQAQNAVDELQGMPPTQRAVMAFVFAPDDVAAETFFAEQKHLLQPYEAQELIDGLAEFDSADTPAEIRQRLSTRAALLRRLRGHAPHSPIPSPQSPIPGDLYQSGRDQHFFSAHAEGGGAATVVNNLFVQDVTRRWLRPTLPSLERDVVPRHSEMEQIRDELARRGSVAVTGQMAQALAVQGMAGVGKTVLAHLLAQEADDRYPDGVIWEELGPDFTHGDMAQGVLRKWAGYATGFFGLPENVQKQFSSEPEAVRALLGEHPRLLVVLDNVWSLAAIRPLREALPQGAHLIITTRSQEIAHGLGGGKVEVGQLREDEAIELFERRLGWRPQRAEGQPPAESADAWAFALMNGVERHALGLDVALGVLAREGGADHAEWQAASARLLAAIRSGDLGDLTVVDDVNRNVQIVLLYSVRALDDEARRRFRWLGRFAPEAPFATAAAAAVWGCDAESARRTLLLFANAALLDRQPGQHWQQHGLLRSLGWALLRQAGETEAAAAAHARAYDRAMAAADEAGRYYELLPALPQLAHAFEWAVENDLDLALNIAANCANLQKQFGQARQAGDWAERALAVAQRRAAPSTLARAWGHRATILSELATLPGEDRRQRLYDALAAYDEALRFRRPDTAPLAYAMTQGNLANLYAAFSETQGEEGRRRQVQSIQAVMAAHSFFEVVGHGIYSAQAQRQALGLRTRFGMAQFPALWAEAGLGEIPDWLSEGADEDENRLTLTDLLQAFVHIQNAEQMMAFWQAVPTAVEEAFMEAVEALIAQAEAGEETEIGAMLRSRLDGFRQIREGAARAAHVGEPLLALLQTYAEAQQAADAENPTPAAWQAITALGEELLVLQANAPTLLDWSALRRQVASDYNTLGNALDDSDKAAALAAYERAIDLQPDFAMWQRNRAGTLIELGRLDEARAAIDGARILEPDAPRLAQLEDQLVAAKGDNE